ncbi:MAG: hypothetical protein QXM65_05025 [Candidatus Bathyarchaeia archaeon]
MSLLNATATGLNTKVKAIPTLHKRVSIVTEVVEKGLKKIGITVSKPVLAVLCIIFGILVILIPALIGIIVGIFLIIEGVLLITEYLELQKQQQQQPPPPPPQ